MKQKIEQLSAKEHEWIESQLNGARKLAEILVGEASDGLLTLSSLDKAFAAWMSGNEKDPDIINVVINHVGIAFGQLLVDGLGLSWVIATDERGSDLVVYGLPGKGD